MHLLALILPTEMGAECRPRLSCSAHMQLHNFFLRRLRTFSIRIGSTRGIQMSMVSCRRMSYATHPQMTTPITTAVPLLSAGSGRGGATVFEQPRSPKQRLDSPPNHSPVANPPSLTVLRDGMQQTERVREYAIQVVVPTYDGASGIPAGWPRGQFPTCQHTVQASNARRFRQRGHLLLLRLPSSIAIGRPP